MTEKLVRSRKHHYLLTVLLIGGFISLDLDFLIAQSVLFEGPFPLPGLGTEADPPSSGAGNRMMWYPEKSAMRLGTVSGSQWDKDNIGRNSLALGTNNIAGEFSSIAWGNNNTVLGSVGTAWGIGNQVSGGNATAWGTSNVARSTRSTVWGTGNYARSLEETVIGRYNDTTQSADPNSFMLADHIFVIGNGTPSVRSNAFEVFKNGNVTVKGTISIEGSIHLKNRTSLITGDDQLITVTSGYIRVSASSAASPQDRTARLSPGSNIGQSLFLESTGAFSWELLDDPSPGANTNLMTSRVFAADDIIQLMWNGTDWLEVHFSDN